MKQTVSFGDVESNIRISAIGFISSAISNLTFRFIVPRNTRQVGAIEFAREWPHHMTSLSFFNVKRKLGSRKQTLLRIFQRLLSVYFDYFKQTCDVTVLSSASGSTRTDATKRWRLRQCRRSCRTTCDAPTSSSSSRSTTSACTTTAAGERWKNWLYRGIRAAQPSFSRLKYR